MRNVKAEVIVDPETFKSNLYIGVDEKIYTISMDYLYYLTVINETAIDSQSKKDYEENDTLKRENMLLKNKVEVLEKSLLSIKGLIN